MFMMTSGSTWAVTLPADEAPHNTLLEWWYFTGHLTGVDPQGHTRVYGFEVSVFQTDIDLPNAVYVTHFAITDHYRNAYKVEERTDTFAIPTLQNGFNLTVDGWNAQGSSGVYSLNTAFADGSYGIQLNMNSSIPPVLHGTNGVIPYGPFGTSSYYTYSNLATTGTIIDHGVPITVTGITWQDRQWGDFSLFDSSKGWNWFAIQLPNNVQYMLYFVQDWTGAVAQKVGTKVVNGVATAVPADQFAMVQTATWFSWQSLYTYPVKWTITVPGGNFTVTPFRKAQEIFWPLHRTYWEGDCTITGTLDGQAVNGLGYTEVNPYWEPYLSMP